MERNLALDTFDEDNVLYYHVKGPEGTPMERGNYE